MRRNRLIDASEAFWDFFADYLGLIMIGVLFGVVVLVVFVVYAVFASATSPTIELRKTEWECTGTRSVPYTTYIQTGKTLVPITNYIDECVEYKRR